jgi:hypothetical protein
MKAFAQEGQASLKERAGEGRELIERFRKNPRKAMVEMVNDGKERFQKVGSNTRKRLDDLADDIDRDARLLIGELKTSGKKAVDGLTGGRTVREAVEKSLRTIPAVLNLPAGDEMDRLADTVESLRDNVDTLRRQCGAA